MSDREAIEVKHDRKKDSISINATKQSEKKQRKWQSMERDTTTRKIDCENDDWANKKNTVILHWYVQLFDIDM